MFFRNMFLATQITAHLQRLSAVIPKSHFRGAKNGREVGTPVVNDANVVCSKPKCSSLDVARVREKEKNVVQVMLG